MNIFQTSSFLYGKNWAIEPKFFNGLVQDIEATKNLVGLASLPNEVFAQLQKTADRTYFTDLDRNEIAESDLKRGYLVIQMQGLMVKYGHWWSSYFGEVGTGAVTNRIKQAEKDNRIEGIIFAVNSPGGHVEGTQELAQTIQNSSKPIVGFIDEKCCSSGVWAICPSKYIVANVSTAETGSIGVLMRHISNKGFYDQYGQEITYLVSPETPKKVVAPDNQPLSDEDRAILTKELSLTYQVFANTVRLNRKKIQEEALTSGRVFLAEEAKDLGLIDQIGGIELCFDKLDSLTSRKSKLFQKTFAMENKGTDGERLASVEKQVSELSSKVDAFLEAQAQEKADAKKEQAEQKAQANKAEKEGLKAKIAKLESENKELKAQLDEEPETSPASTEVNVEAKSKVDKYTHFRKSKHNQF